MAKSLLQMKSKKKPQKTRSEVYVINVKYLGDEPTATESKVDMLKAFNWYHSMCDRSDARQYLKDYFKGDKAALRAIDQISDSLMPYTAAWMCRIASNRSRQLDPEDLQFVTKKIAEATKVQPDEDAKPKDSRPSIQDRMREKLSDIIGEVEALVDSGEVNLYEWLQKNEVPASYAPRIADYYRPVQDEMVQASSGKLDGYEDWTKAQLRARAEFYGRMIADAERYAGVAKQVRKPRKPRPVSVEKVLKNFRYLRESNEFKLASINPETILGAQELWCFNVKYKTITVFRALDRGGLGINRSSITNFDEATSMTRGSGRQTEKVVDRVMKGGKLVLKKVMDELKGTKALQERVNENTILLRVVK
jgi:hypothetical protein